MPAALRRAVAERARHCCEYRGISDEATLAPHEPDHIIGEQHGAETTLANLAYACFRCNRYKGPNIATRDPQTGSLAALFNPRVEQWGVHFRLDMDCSRAMDLNPTMASRVKPWRKRRSSCHPGGGGS